MTTEPKDKSRPFDAALAKEREDEKDFNTFLEVIKDLKEAGKMQDIAGFFDQPKLLAFVRDLKTSKRWNLKEIEELPSTKTEFIEEVQRLYEGDDREALSKYVESAYSGFEKLVKIMKEEEIIVPTSRKKIIDSFEGISEEYETHKSQIEKLDAELREKKAEFDTKIQGMPIYANQVMKGVIDKVFARKPGWISDSGKAFRERSRFSTDEIELLREQLAEATRVSEEILDEIIREFNERETIKNEIETSKPPRLFGKKKYKADMDEKKMSLRDARAIDKGQVDRARELTRLSKEAPDTFDELVILFREISGLEEKREHEQKQADEMIPPKNEKSYQQAKDRLGEYKSGDPTIEKPLNMSIFYSLGEKKYRELYRELDDATRKEVEAEINKPAK